MRLRTQLIWLVIFIALGAGVFSIDWQSIGFESKSVEVVEVPAPKAQPSEQPERTYFDPIPLPESADILKDANAYVVHRVNDGSQNPGTTYVTAFRDNGFAAVAISLDEIASYTDRYAGDWIYSTNLEYAVLRSGYGGGDPQAFGVVVKKGTETVFDRTYQGEQFLGAHGSYPSVEAVSSDGRYVWGLSHIHGTCPCFLSLWRIDTQDGSVAEFPAVDDLWLDSRTYALFVDEGRLLGIHPKSWPPPMEKLAGEEVWYVDLETDEQKKLLDFDQSMVRTMRWSPDGEEFVYSRADWDERRKRMGSDVTYIVSLDGLPERKILSGSVRDWIGDYLIIERGVDVIAYRLSSETLSYFAREYGTYGDVDYQVISYLGGKYVDAASGNWKK